jgi:hypothetical protein
MPASASFLRAVFPSAVNIVSDSIGPPLALQKPAVYTWEAGRARQLLAQLWETMAVTFAFFFSHVEGSDDAAGDYADEEGPRPPSPSIFPPDALLPRPSENPFFSYNLLTKSGKPSRERMCSTKTRRDGDTVQSSGRKWKRKGAQR